MGKSYIAVNNEYYRTPEFIDFISRAVSRCYFFTLSAVNRKYNADKSDNWGGNYIFNEHYMKGELVGRYSQEDIASYIKSSQANVSRYLSELEERKFIKKIGRFTSKTKILYYQVGIWEGKFDTDSYEENLWFDDIFGAYAKVAKQKRGERKPPEFNSMDDMVSSLNKDHPDYKKTLAFLLKK